jgi:hypothetical protein
VCCIFLHVFLLLHHCYLFHMLPTLLGCPWVPPPPCPPPFFFLLYYVLSIQDQHSSNCSHLLQAFGAFFWLGKWI